VRTLEDPAWTRRYHEPDPNRRAFGGRLEILMQDGTVVAGEKAVADAHPNGASPWSWPDYVRKLETLAGELLGPSERAEFAERVRALGRLSPEDLRRLNPRTRGIGAQQAAPRGIFDFA
jgi:2-methylcitrate dehydratase